MNELETQFFVGLRWHFGGGKPYMSGTAGIGVSRQFGFVEPGVNLAVNFYNGGLGARENSNKLHVDAVITGKVTVGGGKGDPMSIYPLHLDSGTGLTDNYRYSATMGSNLIFNNSGRNQHVGFVQLRAENFSFQTYNDFGGFQKIGISDGYDRWWTGGGNITLGANNSPYQLIIASDVFTADTDADSKEDRAVADANLESFTASNTGSWLERTSNKMLNYTPSTASEVDADFLMRERNGVPWTADQHSFNLNQGRTSFRLNTPQGSFGATGIGGGHMYSQDMIHRVINFHLIPSERPNQWDFNYGRNYNRGF